MAIESIAAANTNTTGTAYLEAGKLVQRSIDTTASQILNGNNLTAGTAGTTDKTSGSSQEDKTGESDSQKNEAQRLKKAVDNANSKMKHARTGCEFSYNEELNRVSIKVFDKDTNEVIKEIPPEESLEMLEKLWEIAGLLVDEKR